MKKWEYKTLILPVFTLLDPDKYNLMYNINEWGKKGWEAVGVSGGKSGGNLDDGELLVLLKRELETW